MQFLDRRLELVELFLRVEIGCPLRLLQIQSAQRRNQPFFCHLIGLRDHIQHRRRLLAVVLRLGRAMFQATRDRGSSVTQRGERLPQIARQRLRPPRVAEDIPVFLQQLRERVKRIQVEFLENRAPQRPWVLGKLTLKPFVPSLVEQQLRLHVVRDGKLRVHRRLHRPFAQNPCAERMDRREVRLFEIGQRFGHFLLEFLAQPHLQFAGGLFGERDRHDLVHTRPFRCDGGHDPRHERCRFARARRSFDEKRRVEFGSRRLCAPRSPLASALSRLVLLDRAERRHARVFILEPVKLVDAVAADGTEIARAARVVLRRRVLGEHAVAHHVGGGLKQLI